MSTSKISGNSRNTGNSGSNGKRTGAAPVLSPIVAYRNLVRDNELIKDKLKLLGADAGGVHGDLQVVLSALRRMTEAVEGLIDLEELK